MRLRNKKTGEIVEVESIGHADSLKEKFGWQVTLSWKIDEYLDTWKTYDSLAELNEEWEDIPEEEPKTFWYIDDAGVLQIDEVLCSVINMRKSIGNYFETREEAEKAVEKLKAWKRLKDKGFEFDHWEYEFSIVDKPAQTIVIKANAGDTNNKDLDLLFSQEDN